MRGRASDRLFFVHVMKTSGATFRQHLVARLGAEAVFPDPAVDTRLGAANLRVRHLLELPAERHDRIRAYTGHFPYYVVGCLDPTLVTLTILRDPVDRTVSFLKHRKRYSAPHRQQSLEEIYEGPFELYSMILNHQAKVFSLTPDDDPGEVMDVVAIDDVRLARAKDAIADVDVVGFTDEHDDFVTRVSHRLGWPPVDVRPRRVAHESWSVPDSLVRRIRRDNEADLDFVAHARDVWDRRRRRTLLT